MRLARLCERLSHGLLIGVVLVAPTQWSIQLRPGLHLSPADPLLLLAATAWGTARILGRDWRSVRPLPWPPLALLAWTLLSCVLAADRTLALKEWVQLAAYFGVGYLLFADALARGREPTLRRGAGLLLIAGAGIVGLAIKQYASGSIDTLKVCGTFGNRNVLGGYLALLLPLAFGLLLEQRRLWPRLALLLLVAAGCTVSLAGGAVLALAAVFTLQAARHGRTACVLTIVALTAWAALALPRLPRSNDYALLQSVALYDETGAASRRYPEWQAASVMTLEHPWFGVGPGAYQRHVGQYYGVVPRATGPSEPDIQNLYLVLAGSAGLPAALAFLVMLLRAAGAAGGVAGMDREACARWRGLALGVAGSLAAFALTALWSPLLVRGLGLPLAMILAAAGYLAAPPAATPTHPDTTSPIAS